MIINGNRIQPYGFSTDIEKSEINSLKNVIPSPSENSSSNLESISDDYPHRLKLSKDSEEKSDEYSLYIEEIHNEESPVPSKQNTPQNHAPVDVAKRECSNKRYCFHSLSYDNMTEQTELEIDACKERDIKNCVKYGLISRVLKAASCCLVTPLITVHSLISCTYGTIALLASPSGLLEAFCYNKYNFGITKNLCRSGCTAYCYTVFLCTECWTNIMCCPMEVCVPECTTLAGLPHVYNGFENSKSSLSHWGRKMED